MFEGGHRPRRPKRPKRRPPRLPPQNGEMDTSEVFQCVKTLGWFPTKESIDEAVEMVDKDGTGDISFDEFFKLMQHLRKTEGFTKDEIATFTNLFNKFDVDGSGEISTLELSQILRNP